MEQYSFLFPILSWLALILISSLLIFIPKYGYRCSFAGIFSSYILFLFLILQKDQFILTELFLIEGIKLLVVKIVTIFALIITLLNGWEKMSSLRNSLMTAFIFLPSLFLLGAVEFTTFYISLEFMSLMTYALVSMGTFSFSKEVSLKYFIQGSLVSVIFLLGVVFFFAATGGLSFSHFTIHSPIFYSFSLIFLIAVTAFKMGVFPFHAWLPDVYSQMGKGILLTHFLINKIVIGFVMITLLQYLLSFIAGTYQQYIISFIVLLSLVGAFYGNVLGLSQIQFKRVIAYSSIAHGSYMLMTLCLPSEIMYARQLLFYLIFYSLAVTGAVLLINIFQKEGALPDDSNLLKGGFYRHHVIGVLLSLFILSMAGIPLTAGFSTKFFLFINYFRNGFTLPAFVVLVSSIIGLGFYLKFIITLFMDEPHQQDVLVFDLKSKVIVIAIGAIIVLGGIFPSIFL